MDLHEMQHTVFIADDDDDDLEVLKAAFEEIGCTKEIRLFSTSTSLLETLAGLGSAELPDLVVLDNQMPGRSGCEVVVQIRAQSLFNTIALAVYSTAIAPARLKELEENGVDLCLMKGHSQSQIVEQVQAFCRLAEQKKRKGSPLPS